ncbi:MAG: glycerophosphodiester phosphodiesterase [Acidobacteria bacterium]|nr:glycerophosphodiester phosphodiesterase [Acidobacteriota bacterium]
MFESKRAKRLGVVVGIVLLVASLYGLAARSKGVRAPEREFFRQDVRRPLVIAHRGGAGLWPENTLHAFEGAAALGADVIETDVRSTADGVLVVLHDATVERTTDGAGSVARMTLPELKRLDAGYRWSPDGGRTFPLRGRGLTVPTLEEVFERLPGMRFNIEPKRDAAPSPQLLCGVIRGRGMEGRVVVASFRASLLEEFRRECPEVATSASPVEAVNFIFRYKIGLADSYSPAMHALQVPEYAGGLRVLTKGLVEAAHKCNLAVHAWTVNDSEAMRRLVGMGVDGVMTDYPDRLLEILGRAPAR